MAAKKKYKKLTNAEKKVNKEIREELREKGILPPVKPKLNRKKFAEEVREQWEKDGDIFYLIKGLRWMIPSEGSKQKVTPEQIGALKVMKLAMEIKKFEENLKAKGENQYNGMEFYKEIIAPVLEL